MSQHCRWPAGGYLSGAAFSTSSGEPAQDGIWAGAEGCFLIRGILTPRYAIRAAKEVERTHLSPVPEGTSRAATVVVAEFVGASDYAVAFNR
jgi:hypothetical protein